MSGIVDRGVSQEIGSEREPFRSSKHNNPCPTDDFAVGSGTSDTLVEAARLSASASAIDSIAARTIRRQVTMLGLSSKCSHKQQVQ